MICLLNVPDDVLEKILSYVTYDEVSRCRLVCRRFNSVSQRVLNRGFHKAERYHAQCLRKVKTQLPRRESERRKHPLARHSDILTAVETRLSLLRMTFMKFVDLNLCCFIPGKVLDEIYRVLRYITTESNPIRAHEVLQELRDLSSMAMEYFDEKIAPSLKNKECGPKIVAGVNMIAASCHDSKPGCSHHSTNEVKVDKLYRFTKHLAVRQSSSFKEIRFLNIRIKDLSRKNTDLEKIVMEQQNMLAVQAERMNEQDLRLEILERCVTREERRRNNGLEVRLNPLARADAPEVSANPPEALANPLEVVQANLPEEHANPSPPEVHANPSPPEVHANSPEALLNRYRSQKRKLRPRHRPENNGGTLKKVKK